MMDVGKNDLFQPSELNKNTRYEVTFLQEM